MITTTSYEFFSTSSLYPRAMKLSCQMLSEEKSTVPCESLRGGICKAVDKPESDSESSESDTFADIDEK